MEEDGGTAMIVEAEENGRTAGENATDVDPAVGTQARC